MYSSKKINLCYIGLRFPMYLNSKETAHFVDWLETTITTTKTMLFIGKKISEKKIGLGTVLFIPLTLVTCPLMIL